MSNKRFAQENGASSSGTNVRSTLLGMGFTPDLVDKAIRRNGRLYYTQKIRSKNLIYLISLGRYICLSFKSVCIMVFIFTVKLFFWFLTLKALLVYNVGEDNMDLLLESLFAYSVSGRIYTNQ